ncbi:type II secretion system F family protein [Agrobacterium radiobacter]|uniref:Type II secretion system F family protein n=1 Tax=Agrobacterium radiobacter TaxID=362 RepID=A0ABD5LPJ4_AGRRD
MPSFAYTAFNNDGRQIKGAVDALDLADARRKLKSGGLFIANLGPVEATSHSKWSKLSRGFHARLSITRFFTDLSVLMNAGLGIDQGLRAMLEVASHATDKRMIGNILDQLSSGATAADALSHLPDTPEEIVALIASGERSARLSHVVKVVAADLERRQTHRKQLIDAAVYPLFLLIMLVVALGIVTFVLVPTLEPIFESTGRDLPFLVAVLSGLRQTLSDPLVFLTILTILCAVFLIGVSKPAARKRTLDAVLLRMPLLGRAIRLSALERYLRSLALLLENSVPLPEALSLSARCCPAASFRERLLSVHEVVVSGKRLPEALMSTGLFHHSVISLVAIGDGVNKLPAVLENASWILRAEAQRLTDRLLALFTPVITILLGAIVGGLIVSVMTALLNINELGVQ